MYESAQQAQWQKVQPLPSQSWTGLTSQQLIDLHEKQLEEHRRFLSSLQAEAHHVSGAKQFTEECLAQTEVMMKQLTQSADKFLAATTNPPPQHNSQRPKKVPTGPRLDPSGLFMRDTKPTPPAELLRQTVIRPKRKILGEDEETVSHSESSPLYAERPPKRLRREESQTPENHVDARSESNEQDRAPNGDEPDTSKAPNHVSLAGDSFVQEVEEHLKKKALKKLKKKEKKRKRESAVSDVPMAELEQATTQTSTKPQRKRRKKAAQVLLDEREVGIESDDTAIQTGRTTPQAEKGRNKRLSPASQYLATSLQQVEGRQRSKRQRTAEVK